MLQKRNKSRIIRGVPPGKAILTLATVLTAVLAVFAEDEFPRADSNVVGVCNTPSFSEMLAKADGFVAQLAAGKSEEEKNKLEEELINEYGEKGIECLIRYREPVLIPVFAKLCEHKQWYVRRLAVWALERNCGVSELDTIAARLEDDNFLVRETAAISLCGLITRAEKYWKDIPATPDNVKAMKGLKVAKQKHIAALKARLGKEDKPYVKTAIEGALLGLTKSPPTRIHEEPLVGKNPPRRIPYGETGQLSQYIGTGDKFNKEGGGKTVQTKSWGYPVSVYPREIIAGLNSDKPLKPLADRGNSLHFGHDCAWFLEGAGIYAIADGTVKMVKHGGDWGGLIVVEHMVDAKTHVCALYGHSGMWVFANAGTPVKRGQLLGVMGLSFSPENGGHGAHSHFGMFSGKFQATKCYGRGAAGSPTEGWLIPADFLGPKVEGKTITVESYK